MNYRERQSNKAKERLEALNVIVVGLSKEFESYIGQRIDNALILKLEHKLNTRIKEAEIKCLEGLTPLKLKHVRGELMLNLNSVQKELLGISV